MQLIAIGGTIGTGLFLGSGKAIQLAGPSIIFAYFIVGIALFFVMRALGELLFLKRATKIINGYCRGVFRPRAAFVIGWTYWFCWIMGYGGYDRRRCICEILVTFRSGFLHLSVCSFY
ncbi:hypothetical protein ABOZ80_00620 [Bacillus stercoris]|uniref:hypothetical protein n=1 Tax=Bacillus stercoris TaxID=2054641 RepID=UPI000B1ECD33